MREREVPVWRIAGGLVFLELREGTQSYAAECIGVSQGTLSRCERGLGLYKEDRLHSACEHFGTSLPAFERRVALVLASALKAYTATFPARRGDWEAILRHVGFRGVRGLLSFAQASLPKWDRL